MIKETIILKNTVEKAGIAQGYSTSIMFPNKTEKIFVVSINDNLDVLDVEIYNGEDRFFWFYNRSNQSRFPIIRVPFTVSGELEVFTEEKTDGKEEQNEIWKRRFFASSLVVPEAKRDCYKQVIKNMIIGPINELSKLNITSEKIIALIRSLQECSDEEYRNFLKLALQKITVRIKEQIDNGQFLIDEVRELFKRDKLNIALQYCDTNIYSQEACQQFSNDMRSQELRSDDDKRGICSITGIEISYPDSYGFFQVQNKSFPRISLYNRKNDNKPYIRYGMGGSEAFPMDPAYYEQMESSMQYILDEQNRKKTWTPFLSDKKKQNTILVAYLVEQPVNNMDFAMALYGDFSQEKEIDADSFVSFTAPIFEEIKEIDEDLENSHIRVFILEQIDRGRQNTIYNETFNIQYIKQKRDEWIRGCKNFAEYRTLFSAKKPFPLFLFQVYRILGERYLSNDNKILPLGKNYCCISKKELLNLCWGETNLLTLKTIEKYLISKYLQMFLDLPKQKRGNKKGKIGKNIWICEKRMSEIMSLLGVLIFKEKNLMNEEEKSILDLSYKIGKLMAIGDGLQEDYYKLSHRNCPQEGIGGKYVDRFLRDPEGGWVAFSTRANKFKNDIVKKARALKNRQKGGEVQGDTNNKLLASIFHKVKAYEDYCKFVGSNVASLPKIKCKPIYKCAFMAAYGSGSFSEEHVSKKEKGGQPEAKDA